MQLALSFWCPPRFLFSAFMPMASQLAINLPWSLWDNFFFQVSATAITIKEKKGLKSIFVKPFEEHTDKGTDIKMITNGPNSENFLIKNS